MTLTPPPPATHGTRRVRLLPGRVEPWASVLADHSWTLTGPDDEADVVVCLDEDSARTAREPSDAVTIHLVPFDGTWAGEGADTVLYDPSVEDFIEACERGVRMARARGMAVEYVTEVLECIPDAFFILDWDWRVVYQNRAALASVARREGGNGDVLGDLLHEHLPDEVRDVLSAPALARLRDGEPLHVAGIDTGPTSARVEANAYLIPSGAAVFFRDGDVARNERASFAHRSARHGPAPDRASPLDSVRRNQRILREMLERATDDGKVAVRSARAMLALLDQVDDGLALIAEGAGLGDPRERPGALLDLSKTVRDALRRHRITSTDRVCIKTRYGATPRIRGEAEQVQALVVGLVREAIDALGPRAGTVRVTTRAEPDAAVLVVEEASTGVTLAARWNAPATGRLVEDLGGTMTLDIVPHGGLACTVRLPACAEGGP